MKLTITDRLLGSLLALLLLPACGSLTSDQELTVEMYGMSKTPENAAGDRDPQFQIYQLTQIDLVSTDGTLTNFFDGVEEKIFRIVDREQLIYSQKIDDLVGNSYSGIQIAFAPLVTGGESGSDAYEFTLSSPALTLSQEFTVEKAKSRTLIIKINWGNTLSDTAMTEPQYELSLD